MRAFRPCTTCGWCPIWWQPHGGCQNNLSNTCTANECNRTVRAIGASRSSTSDFPTTAWEPNVEIQADHANPVQQFYSQISWPYYDIYLGIVMIFDAGNAPDVFGKGKVHCDLAWSPDGLSFSRVLPGQDFIPQILFLMVLPLLLAPQTMRLTHTYASRALIL